MLFSKLYLNETNILASRFNSNSQERQQWGVIYNGQKLAGTCANKVHISNDIIFLKRSKRVCLCYEVVRDILFVMKRYAMSY